MKKPYLKLRRLIEDEGLDAPEDSGCWLPREITSICQVLHIPQEKIGEYFFPQIAKEASA